MGASSATGAASVFLWTQESVKKSDYKRRNDVLGIFLAAEETSDPGRQTTVGLAVGLLLRVLRGDGRSLSRRSLSLSSSRSGANYLGLLNGFGGDGRDSLEIR